MERLGPSTFYLRRRHKKKKKKKKKPKFKKNVRLRVYLTVNPSVFKTNCYNFCVVLSVSNCCVQLY